MPRRSAARGLAWAVALALGVAASVRAQGWSTTLEGEAGPATDLRATADGGYVACGTTAGGAWVARVAADGAIESLRVLEPASAGQPVLCAPTLDGGVLVAGSHVSVGGHVRTWLARLDASGAISWQRSYDVPASRAVVRALAARADGGAALAAGDADDPAASWLLVTTPAGQVVRSSVLPLGRPALVASADGGVVAAGTLSSGLAGLIRCDARGVGIDVQALDLGCTSVLSIGIAPLAGGGFVAAGSQLCGFARTTFVVKLDASLQPSLAAEIGGLAWSPDVRAIVGVPGGIVLAGTDGVSGRALAAKLDAALNVDWVRVLREGPAAFASLVPVADGGVLAAGSWKSVALLARLDASGATSPDCATLDEATFTATRLPALGSSIGFRLEDVPIDTHLASLVIRDAIPRSGVPGDVGEPDSCGSRALLLASAPLRRDFCDDAEDWFEIHACSGATYALVTSSLGPLANTAIDLFDGGCSTVVATDDDGGGGLASRLEWTATRDGTFPVRVRQADGTSGPGRGYDVRLVEVTPSCGAWLRGYAVESGPSWVELVDVTALPGGDIVVVGASSDPREGRPTGDYPAVLRLGPGGDVRGLEELPAAGPNGPADIASTAGGHVIAWTARIDGVTRGVVRAGDRDGATLWQKTCEAGSGLRAAELVACAGLRDGGIVAGGQLDDGGERRPWLLRLDASGEIVWSRWITCETAESVVSIRELSDGTLVVVGRADSSAGNAFAAVLDANGVVTSYRTLGIADRGAWVDVAADGAIFVATGRTCARIDANGDFGWALEHGTPLGAMPYWRAVLATDDGGCLLAGTCWSSTGTCNGPLLLKLDASGSPDWFRSLDETGVAGSGDVIALARLEGSIFVALTSGHSVLRLDLAGSAGLACAPAAMALPAEPRLVTSTVEAASSEAIPVTVTDAYLSPVSLRATATEPCAASIGGIPGEVAPRGAAVPLLVRLDGLLTWAPSLPHLAVTYDVYRGDLSLLSPVDHGACLAPDFDGTSYVDADPPPPGGAWFYLVTAENAAGEGTMGFDSFGVERVNASPCP